MRSGTFSHKPDFQHELRARLRHSATCDFRSKPYAEKDEYFGAGSKYQFCKSDRMSKASGGAAHRIASQHNKRRSSGGLGLERPALDSDLTSAAYPSTWYDHVAAILRQKLPILPRNCTSYLKRIVLQ
jgi:hypothetical protein